jgi:hypothetical protein
MTVRLAGHNSRVRAWANKQPPKYRKSALAFGYPCDRFACEFTQTLRWVQANARKNGVDISESTLKRHLVVFKQAGVIEETKHRAGKENRASTYRVHFDRVMPTEGEDMSVTARFAGTQCTECGQAIAKGDEIEGDLGNWHHVECPITDNDPWAAADQESADTEWRGDMASEDPGDGIVLMPWASCPADERSWRWSLHDTSRCGCPECVQYRAERDPDPWEPAV